MLMLFDVRQDSAFLTELVETSQSFLKRFIVTNSNTWQMNSPPSNAKEDIPLHYNFRPNIPQSTNLSSKTLTGMDCEMLIDKGVQFCDYMNGDAGLLT
jgi:hypothetical protein